MKWNVGLFTFLSVYVLYENIDQILPNRSHGPMHYKIGVTCVYNVLCSVVMTQQSNPPISQFNSWCNLFTSVSGKCLYTIREQENRRADVITDLNSFEFSNDLKEKWCMWWFILRTSWLLAVISDVNLCQYVCYVHQ